MRRIKVPAFWFGHFPRQRGGDDQNPKFLRNLRPSEIRFFKSYSKVSKNPRVGGQGNLDFSKESSVITLLDVPVLDSMFINMFIKL